MSTEAVTVAKEIRKKQAEGDARAHVLSTGVRARLKPVSQSIIQDALALLKEPRVPMWANPDKDGREEPNPVDPDYIEAMEQYRQEQMRVSFNVLSFFGIELIDGLPEDDGWLRRLKVMHKLGHIDLDKFDLDDEIDREFLYKRYVAMGNPDFVLIGALSGISPEEVDRAAASFRGDAERGANSDSPDTG